MILVDSKYLFYIYPFAIITAHTVAFDEMNDDERRSEQARLATRAGQEGPLKPVFLLPLHVSLMSILYMPTPLVHSSISLFLGRSKYALSNLVRLHGPAMTDFATQSDPLRPNPLSLSFSFTFPPTLPLSTSSFNTHLHVCKVECKKLI